MNRCADWMNANRASRFPAQTTTFSARHFQNQHRLSSVSSESLSSQEIVMASSRTHRVPQFVFASTPALTGLLWANAAFASQGPGGGPGTASSFTQLTMAIIVFGTSALVVGAGLLGAARRR
jgi:hypothetical protein